jgi:hydrogenase maturation protein HypF
VFIEAEGEKGSLDTFILRVGEEKPPLASVQSMECTFLDPCGSSSFEILKSTASGETGALVLPDIATCPECLAEIVDPANRRHMYPFTNCTNCGPRFTIIESLPYDRPNTSMRSFPMCDDCRREYENPADRRFHAQPIGCPACGPRLALWDENGNAGARDHDALLQAARLLKQGRIVALKGIGGFQLMADAGNDEAVTRLRSRKHREEKPFALMARDIATVRGLCEVSPQEERVLVSSESPIVLLRKKEGTIHHAVTRPGSPVAPGNPFLGIMLPSSPLHHILLGELASPVVATSGNLTDEPICTDEHEAVRRLGGIADAFLVHNRSIVRHADDSIVRVMLGRELVTRRARGFSPLPVRLGFRAPEMLAVGAHLKNTVAVSRGENVFISQHIGDLETKESLDAFHRGVRDMLSMFSVTPVCVVSDLHPDYLSTGFAQSAGFPLIKVQHHHAHIASCMAENGLRGTVLGISWDGTGYGTDGTIWGGEFLLADGASFERFAALKRFRLPGGEKAIREPRRQALGLLFEALGPEVFARGDILPLRSFTREELSALRTMLERGVNAPYTTSAGRLFDAVASITGLQQVSSYEGQAAMALEFALGEDREGEYRFDITESSTTGSREKAAGSDEHRPRWTVDWSPMVTALLEDMEGGRGTPAIAARFHNGLAEAAVEVARRSGENRIVLSGGCFQNRYLTERIVRRLREEGFRPYWHQRVPPNDGGIALGQIAVAAERMLKEQRTP